MPDRTASSMIHHLQTSRNYWWSCTDSYASSQWHSWNRLHVWSQKVSRWTEWCAASWRGRIRQLIDILHTLRLKVQKRHLCLSQRTLTVSQSQVGDDFLAFVPARIIQAVTHHMHDTMLNRSLQIPSFALDLAQNRLKFHLRCKTRYLGIHNPIVGDVQPDNYLNSDALEAA